jgi:hypothetical protein
LYIVKSDGTVMLGWNFRAFSFLILPQCNLVLADSTLFFCDAVCKGINLWVYGSYVEEVSWDNCFRPFCW